MPQVILSFYYQTLFCSGNEHEDYLFCELNLENDTLLFLSKNLDLGHENLKK